MVHRAHTDGCLSSGLGCGVMDGASTDGKPLLYLVAETKGAQSLDDLRPDERRKIHCGAAHFGSTQFKTEGALDDVDYRVVTSAGELP